jgi:transposase
MMQGKKIYQEKLFLNYRLSDHVPADNLYRRLNEIINFDFIYTSTAKYYGKEGQMSIDPVVFMKLLLAGYLENLNSDRRIINSLGLRLDIRYFIGYDLDEELPWHSTLSRTRKLYGEHIFMELFKKVLKQCIDNGMISGRRQAVDGVFIKANAAMDSMLEKAILADADSYGQELEANEETPATEAPKSADKKKGDGKKDTMHSSKPQVVSHLNQEAAGATVLALDIKKRDEPENGLGLTPNTQAISSLDNEPAIAAVVNFCDEKRVDAEKNGSPIEKSHPIAKTHYSPVDPDARLSTKRGKLPDLNYLGEISVDTASHMITHVQAFLADQRDCQCLPGMLSNMVSNLKENDIIVKEVTADAGFNSGKTLKTLEAMGITGYIPNTGAFHPDHEGFTYHAEGDYFECRNGKRLTYLGTYDDKKRYRRTKMNCIGCPFKDTCIGDKQEMAINETIYKPYLERMQVRMQTRKAGIVMKKRQSTVEPVIGTLVGFHGMKKVNSRGLAQANKCLTMAAIAYNIKKLLNLRPRRSHDNMNELTKLINNSIEQLLAAIGLCLGFEFIRFSQRS